MKSCFILMSCLLAANGAYAQASEGKGLERITFDFTSMQVFTSGLYKPSEERKSASGLEAETAARREGILFFSNYVESSCSGIDNVSAKNSWQQVFRSQGSTVFPEGTLEILLRAPYSDVFQLSSVAQAPHKEDGSKVVFVLPSSLPGSAVRCGAMVLELGQGKSAYIVPKKKVEAAIASDKDSKNKYIKLVFDDKKDVLRPEKPEEVSGLTLGPIPTVTGVMYTTISG